jgi:hypothetical protein
MLVDRISARARQVQFSRSLLALAAGLLFGVGWLMAKLFGGAWLAFVWVRRRGKRGLAGGTQGAGGPSVALGRAIRPICRRPIGRCATS